MFDIDATARDLVSRIRGPASFGHLRYVDAPDRELVLLANKQYLRVPAARAFLEMSIKAHQDASINILPAYCFRRFGFQRNLFLSWAKKKQVGFEENLRRVAPPGYSEHHTGYAIDINDGPGPRQDLKIPFQQRPAFEWLTENAAEFGFENSFPRGNVQGVMCEPWHWRWVGNEHAETLFQPIRDLTAADGADPRVGEALRAGAESGIDPHAAPEVTGTIKEILDRHWAICSKESDRLAKAKKDDRYQR